MARVTELNIYRKDFSSSIDFSFKAMQIFPKLTEPQAGLCERINIYMKETGINIAALNDTGKLLAQSQINGKEQIQYYAPD